MIEVFLSTDGKMTVRTEINDSADLKKAYAIYDDIVKKYGASNKRMVPKEGLGNCEKCDAPMKMSKKGKPYCSETCWIA